jgi:hypothetical protein
MLHDLVALIDLDGLERNGAADGVRRVGVAMAELPELAALLEHRLVEIVLDGDGAHGEVSGSDGLGHRNGMGRHAHGLRAEPIAGAAEAADHLIRNVANVVFGEHGVDLGVIVRGRNNHAPCPHDRLGDEGGNRIRPLALDHIVEVLGHAGGELLLALARQRVAVVMRAGGMQDIGDRQVEVGLHIGQAGERARGDGYAVIAAQPRDDLLLLRLGSRIVVVPSELHLHVVGFGARGTKQDLGSANRHDLLELLGKLDRHVVGLAAEDMSVGQPAHLARRGLDQLLIDVAECCAPQAGHALDIAPALVIVDVDALGLFEDRRPHFAMLGEIGVGMDHRLDIADGHVGERGQGQYLRG